MTADHGMAKTAEHLRLLSIFHYVVGGITGLFACIPVIHLVTGIVFMVAPGDPGEEFPARLFGIIFAVVAVIAILIGWTIAILIILAGNFLRQHRRYTFCMVIAALSCLQVPFGTILGVFTIVVLTRDEAKALFNQSGGAVPKPVQE